MKRNGDRILALSLLVVCGCGPREAALPSDAVVLAFGDSITEGYGADASQSYPAVLETVLGCKVINEGASGEVSSQGVVRLPDLLRRHKPAVVVICYGGNDFLRGVPDDEVARNLQRMLDACRGAGAKAALLGVPKPGLFLRAVPLYAELAKRNGLPIDAKIISRVLSSSTLKSDLIHPNAEGYRRIAEAVSKLVRQAAAEACEQKPGG